MNLPDQLILGGAAMALASVIMVVLVIYLGNREMKKKSHDKAIPHQH